MRISLDGPLMSGFNISSRSCLLVGVVCACTPATRKPADASETTLVDTVMVYDATHGIAFPQFQDSSRLLPDGSIRPNPRVPSCPLGQAPDTLDWSSYEPTQLHGMRLRLPAEFNAPVLASDRITIWEGPPPAPGMRPASRIRLMISPEQGYPIVSIGSRASQTRVDECSLTVQGRSIAVALFTVAFSQPHWPVEHFVAARWDLSPKIHAQLLAEGQDSSAQTTFLAVLRSLRFSTQ
jgi:hypothetical protein